ncbi:MAG: hypothetical protein JXB45_04850, partial [Candidatus Krumholzibacteriota bacterium]|nr:hypothetical protein [Candidatus Krumholzibacteriota bacterium]
MVNIRAFIRIGLILPLFFLIPACIEEWDPNSPWCRDKEKPGVIIDSPPVAEIYYNTRCIAFTWHSALEEEPLAVRYLCIPALNPLDPQDQDFDILADLNAFPEHYESLWSDWIKKTSSDPPWKEIRVGDPDPLVYGTRYLFAVQAKDRCAQLTPVFTRDENARIFLILERHPALMVHEDHLGIFSFCDDDVTHPVQFELPPGIPLKFSWQADASSYGGQIVSYRYGWDVMDIANPYEWDCAPHITCTETAEKRLYSGIHTLIIEAVDNYGSITYGVFELTISDIFTMERDLLWVDDFYSNDTPKPLREMPTESEHDAFWTAICEKAAGFVSDRDIYDSAQNGGLPPTAAEIGRYKNIIWTFCSSSASAWRRVVIFTHESWIIPPPSVNYLPLFLESGGHLLTCGKVDKPGGGLTDAFPEQPLLPASFLY